MDNTRNIIYQGENGKIVRISSHGEYSHGEFDNKITSKPKNYGNHNEANHTT